MTLTQLDQKHNLEPESAKVFLREWLSKQQVWAYFQTDADGGVYIVDANEYIYHKSEIMHRGWTSMEPLIARPTDLGE